MNYIQQINGFWVKSESCDLNGNDIAVYFSLLKYCNRLNWLNPFVCHWDIVCQYAKVSKNTYYKSLEKLNAEGFINYEKGKKNTLKPKVFILKFKNNKGTVKEQNEEQKGNLYKLLNKETIKLISENISLVNSKIGFWIKSNREIDISSISTYEEKIEFFILELAKETDYIKGMYALHKLKPDRLGYLVKNFKNFCLTLPDQSKPKDLNHFRNFFTKWVKQQFDEGKYSHYTTKRLKGSL